MIIPIEVAMSHLYADEADRYQVERKLASAIESAERYMGRRIYDDDLSLAQARDEAAQRLAQLPPPNPLLSDMQYQDLLMQANSVLINPSIEIGILLILGDLYANRENTTDKAANELPMGARYHLQPFRVMGV